MATIDETPVVAQSVRNYLEFLAKHPDGEEIQYRTPFETLINSLQMPNKHTIAIQEDRHSGIEVDGTPDFFVYEGEETLFKTLVGFIECKKPNHKLENLINSEQIKKYAKTCENIIITNYHHFILLQSGKQTHDITLSADPTGIQDFLNLLRDFYHYDYPYIRTKKTLVNALAAQSFYYSVSLRQFIADKNNENKPFYMKFKNLFEGYQQSINYHYELADFCDTYSQTLVYGLLLARLDTEEKLNEDKLDYLSNIPFEYKLLYEFLAQGYDMRIRALPTLIKIALTNHDEVGAMDIFYQYIVPNLKFAENLNPG
ncbi:hypothetical protein AGMMS49965_03860 [Bacteroidia bacterium]|nr:hypothetical protein AGMMS49965_03860 [Bacteroidia bacterium]